MSSLPAVSTLLIVEDSETDRLTYRRYLEKDNENTYRIYEATNLEEGLELWQSQQPDLILLDLLLPDGDGFELLEIIQQADPQQQAGVIVLTGQGNEQTAVQAMKLGAADYLVKGDINAVSLRTRSQQVLNYQQLHYRLQRSQQKETLIAQTALRIQQHLELDQVLNSVVEEVKEILKADRTVVYQFEPDWQGKIVAEAVSPPWRTSLDAQIQDTCFQATKAEKYHQGGIFATDDIYAANLSECHLQLLEEFQVRANLVVPILLPENPGSTLWGLLMAHQCSAPRHWQETDLELLKQLSVQIAIAIKQAISHAQLQREVAERKKAEARWHFALENAGDGVWDWNIKTNKIFYSHQWKAMLGYTEDEISPDFPAWESRVHPEDLPRAHTLINEHLKGNTPTYTCEHRLRCQDGHYKWILARGKVVEWTEDGQPLRVIGTHTDLTARKKAEAERLRAQQTRQELKLLENILETVLAGYWDWDLRHNTTYLSPRFKQMFGYADHELPNCSETWQRLIFPEDLPKVLAEFDRHAESRGEIPYYNEVRYRHKDGSTIWVICSGQVIEWDEAGNPLRMVGCHVDITERKQAEEKLRTSEATLLAAQRIGRLGNWGFEIATEKITWSPELFRMFGVDPAQGEPPYPDYLQMLHPDDRSKMDATIKDAIAQAEPYNIEYRVLHPDGSIHYHEGRAQIKTDDQGQVTQLFGIALDLTERKQTEFALAERTAELERFFDVTPDLLAIANTKGYFLKLNRQWEKVLGYPLNELEGAKFLDYVHPDDMDNTLRQMGILSERNPVINFKNRYRRADGSYCWLEWQSVVSDSNVIYGAARDITERQRFEQEILQAKEAAEAAARAKGLFLANMSHEIRTPMNGVMGMLTLLEDTELNPEQRNNIKVALSSADSLLTIINDILDFSKVDAGKIDLENLNFNLRDSLTDLTQAMTYKAKEKGLKLNLNFSAIEQPIVRGDKGRLRQIFTNLINNALKFTHQGEITIRGQLEAIDAKLRFTGIVQDTGIGIPADKIDTLFDTFTQADASTTRKYGGTGLGLAIVQKLCQLMEGEISVTSELGQGSQFTFTLYFDPPQAAPPSTLLPTATSPMTSPKLSSHHRILLVEDHRVNQLVITKILQKQGLTVDLATNGVEALNALKQSVPDSPYTLVFMDCLMPEMDGYEASRQIRAGQAGAENRDIPIVALTANALKGEREKCLEAGMNDHLTKPITSQRLAEILNTWLNQ